MRQLFSRHRHRSRSLPLTLATAAVCACSGPPPASRAPAPAKTAVHTAALIGSGDLPNTSTAPVIDGVMDADWAAVPARTASTVVRGAISGAADLSLAWRAVWDSSNLYVYADVTDDAIVLDGPQPWEDDSLEIYLDGDKSGGTQYDGDDHQFVFRVDDPVAYVGSSSPATTAGITFKTVRSTAGYTVEVAIPWTTIGVVPTAGRALGIDVQVNDDDDGGDREGKLATFAANDDGWTNPSVFGSLTLGTPPVAFEIANTAQVPAIDGVRDPLWDGTATHEAANVVRGSVDGPADLSASWRALWDTNALYVYGEIRDDVFAADSSLAPWEDDSVELFLDGDNNKGTSYDGRNDFQLVFRVGDPAVHVGVNSVTNTSGITFAIKNVPNSNDYSFEAAIPWSVVGITPSAGAALGFDFHVNDDDNGGDREGKLATFARSDDTWTNPSLFGTVALGAGATRSGTRLAGQVVDASGAPVAGATVSVQACASCAAVTTTSDSTGTWVIDGCASGTTWAPQNGAEALGFTISAAGLRTVTLFRNPALVAVPQAPGCSAGTVNARLYASADPDTDSDGLSDGEEQALGLNPNLADTDGDALPDKWEVRGDKYIDLAARGANSRRKDVFVECSYMTGRRPPDASFTLASDTFSRAPVTNVDGSTGISLHLELRDEVPYDNDLNPSWTEFSAIKSQHFSTARANIYHYCIFANAYDATASSGLSFGINAQDFIVSLGWAWDQYDYVGGTILHELGHNLGLQHGGDDSLNNKPNYFSVMSYRFQFPGLTIDGVDHHYDYARWQLETLQESALDEVRGLELANGGSDAFLHSYTIYYNLTPNTSTSKPFADANIDWNGDGNVGGIVSVDVNGDGYLSALTAWNDWDHLSFNGGGPIGRTQTTGAQVARLAAPAIPPKVECAPVPASR